MNIQRALLLLLVLLAASAEAQELVYTPINPSFGGSPFNASWLLSEAQAQNSFTDPAQSPTRLTASDPLTDFKANLSRQILSQLSRQLITNTFGETELQDGHYELGDFIIDVTSTQEGVVINIIDKATGGETNIIVPYF